MPDLGTWANIAEVIGGITVVGGLTFAMLEIRRTRRERHEAAALETVRAGQSAVTMAAVERLYDVAKVNQQMLDSDAELRAAMTQLWAYYETLGYLVYRRIIPLQILDEFSGGALRLLWDRCDEWVTSKRESPGAQNAWEWIEWLHHQVETHPAPGKVAGAHISYRDWKP